ncbi:Uma2 family endonuclease [Nonomuraea wenchangensis]|uniref:Endonuclease, Uma2 family (Restriction endonuclease fold) n=1 Tax=Nonomuraea wenchangensis TaxID=568860 RepID=A0A1I0JR12_9ACTN|nr:Uma2 family endonuclease [Nonomuraea wenchangensis]SEU12976.1 Endonuclease, Uma2 family (restriction endonuclease fold) [Nonomuraea wenchangensis]
MATIEPSTERTILPGVPPYTVDDLLKFPDDGNRYELFNGSLLVSPAPTPLHQRIISRIMLSLMQAEPPHLETLTTVNVRITDKDYYIPDIVVVPLEVTDKVGLMFGPSDVLLAVEVGSPSTRMRDEGLKTLAYAQARVPIYWRVEPDEGPALYVYELDGDAYGPPAVHKAGSVAELSRPFPLAFDPAAFAA